MRAIPTLKISISGVRGVVGQSLTPKLLTRFAQAFGTHTGSGTIVIGRDPRTSGEMVKHAVVAGLLSTGSRVIDIGVCPVPTVQLQVRQRRAQGGIAITASHNPAEWNALKFIGSNGLFLDSGQARELLDIYHQGEYTRVGGAELRTVEEVAGATDLHIKAILDALGPLPPSEKKLRVVLDSCNGAGSLVGPKLIEALGAEVIPINVTPDGSFPRPAEPVPENLGDLCRAVKEHKAHVGFAQDMDADRLAIVSDRGEPIGEDYTLVLAILHVLGREKGAVVANLSTTTAVADIASRFDCPVFLTKIGEVNVTDAMQQHHAVIGGEGNGGVIYPRINFARDSLVGIALVLHLLAESGKSVTELLEDIPRYTIVKEKMTCPSDRIPKVLRLVRQEFSQFPMDTRDGVKVILPDGWLLVRGSNTEPIIRVVAEAKNEGRAKAIVSDVISRLGF
ncbi:MAG TPA: phosphoglucosamine mutase [Pyrinomonadaceae bacterium]|jgi:phosphomannomutase|nr:phosphoglucosamine mutase [Pyrinomonadaceae bacterium]